jgi:hypothetical protein
VVRKEGTSGQDPINAERADRHHTADGGQQMASAKFLAFWRGTLEAILTHLMARGVVELAEKAWQFAGHALGVSLFEVVRMMCGQWGHAQVPIGRRFFPPGHRCGTIAA